jgi:hypothetical protein
MGLDVIALSAAMKISDLKEDPNFEHSKKYFDVIPAPNCSWNDGITAGKYVSPQEHFHFYAGSYSSCDHFRLLLFMSANKISQDDIYSHPDKYQGLPFSQLVYPLMDTGVFGPTTSLSLFKMFVKYQDFAKQVLGNPGHYLVYLNFTSAFRIASNNGMVILY